jgi:hypothetical protein
MIKLGKSVDYLKLALLIYLSAIVALYYSACPLLLKLLGFALLLLQLLRIALHPIPSSCSFLIYTNGHWLLHDEHAQQKVYAKIRLVISTGLFFLVEFSGEKQWKRSIVIFVDQINENDHRLLKIIGRIN